MTERNPLEPLLFETSWNANGIELQWHGEATPVWPDEVRSKVDIESVYGLYLLSKDPDKYHDLVRRTLPIVLHKPEEDLCPDHTWINLDEDERDTFHNIVMKHVRRFLARIDLPPGIRNLRIFRDLGIEPIERPEWWEAIIHPADTDPILWLDAILVNYLRAELVTKGPKSKEEEKQTTWILEEVASVERVARERWETWEGRDRQVALIAPETWQAQTAILRLWTCLDLRLERFLIPRWLALLAALVWKVEAEPRIQDGRRKHEALPGLFTDPLAYSLRTGRWDENRRAILDSKGHDLPLVFLEVPEKVAELAGLEALGALTAQRAFRWMARTAQRRALDGEAEPDVVTLPGGWRGWAREIGAPSKGDADTLHDLALVARRVTVRWEAPEGYGELPLLQGFQIRSQGKSDTLTLYLSRLFLPGIAAQLPQGDRTLVPVLDVPSMGTLGPRLHPAAARLDWLALSALTERAEELVKHGGAELPWFDLADQAGLARKHLATVHEAWMERWHNKGSRWTLADSDPATRRALAFIREGGEARIAGRVKGLTSARKKQYRLK